MASLFYGRIADFAVRRLPCHASIRTLVGAEPGHKSFLLGVIGADFHIRMPIILSKK